MQVNDARCRIGVVERKEKVEAALARLRSLKSQISKLRLQCEALKRLETEATVGFACNKCGEAIDEGEEVALKDSFGNVKKYYHKDCFKAIWLSQSWTFDYSRPGFLRMSGTDL